jgi:hypothetical protein
MASSSSEQARVAQAPALWGSTVNTPPFPWVEPALPILDNGFSPGGVEWEFRAGRVGALVKMQVFTAVGGGGCGGTGLPAGCVLRVTWRGWHGRGVRTLAAEVAKSVEEAVVSREDGSEQGARVVRAPGLDYDFVFVLVEGSDPVAIRVKTRDGSTYSEAIEAPA